MYNSDSLVELLKVMGSVPDGRFSDNEFLSLAYLALISDVMPEFVNSREEYYVRKKVYDVISGTAYYRLPSRAYLGLIRQVQIMNNGKFVNIDSIRSDAISDENAIGQPTGYTVESNSIRLYPTPDGATKIRISYWQTPAKIVLTSECALVSSVAGNVITLTSVPASFTTAKRFDIVKGTSDYEPIEMDLIATDVTATPSARITFASATLSAEIEQGDYVTLAQESPFAHLHAGFYPALLQAAKGRVFESLGQESMFAASISRAQQMIASTRGLLLNRVQGASQPITSNLV